MMPDHLATIVATSTTATSPPLIDAASPGSVHIQGQPFVNMASCDYLGFARDPRVIEAASNALHTWGLGSAATRILSGGSTLHRDLEHRIAAWVGCDDAILYGSCWTANAAILGGLAQLAKDAETSLTVYSDRLNHASIIDGIRGQRQAISALHLFTHPDLAELEQHLATTTDTNTIRVIITDGIFSMEGDQAPLADLCALAEAHNALLVVDDSHGTGTTGETGRGTFEAQNVLGQVDVVTGTFGKALGGASGGFIAAHADLISAIRAISRPYIFSNNPPYAVAAAALTALDILATDSSAISTMRQRVTQLREGVSYLGLHTMGNDHPIVPILLGDESRAREMAIAMQTHGIYATPLAFPVVPRGEARLRLQVSAAHTPAAINQVLTALEASIIPGDGQ